MTGGFGEAGAGGFGTGLGAEAALRSLRARIAVQATAEPRAGLEARRLLLPLRDIRSCAHRAEAVLASLLDFERTLVEHGPDAEREEMRRACLDRLDDLIAVVSRKDCLR